MDRAVHNQEAGARGTCQQPPLSEEGTVEGEVMSPGMDRWECTACSYVYDLAQGDPGAGIGPGTAFENLPDTWTCPICGFGKEWFEKIQERNDEGNSSLI